MSAVRARPERRRVEAPAVLALGANLGDREATLDAAVRDVAAAEGVELVAVSPLYETPALRPDGVDPSAPAYLNGVVLVTTTLDPHALLALAHRIEDSHGRERSMRWGDRTLDIDLIDVDGVRVQDGTLTLPHPEAHSRAFVLAPWHDLEPDAVLVGHGPIAELLRRADDSVRLFRGRREAR